MLAPVACGEDETTMIAPCPSGHFSSSVTETPVGSRRVVRLAHGLPNQPSDMAASRLAVIDVRPESGEYATNLAKRGTPTLPSSIALLTASSSCSKWSMCVVVNVEIPPREPGQVGAGKQCATWQGRLLRRDEFHRDERVALVLLSDASDEEDSPVGQEGCGVIPARLGEVGTW